MRISKYNHIVTSVFEEQYLAFNALSGSFMVMDANELGETEDLFSAVEETDTLPDVLTDIQARLVEGGFIFDGDAPEESIVHNRYYEGLEHNKGLNLTVTPTVSCNFGCGYCFQRHSNRRMDQNDIDNLKAFAAERLEPHTSLSITWFGGEPLTAFDIIEELAPFFAELAEKRHSSFNHSIITNGYLLSVDKAKFLASFPNFNYAQITIDGAPAHHNQRRHTLGKQDTFDRILANIKKVSPIIDISIRVNVDRRNIDGLEELLHILKREGLQERVGVYLGHVWEYTEEVEESQFLTKEEFATVQAQFQFMKFRMGFSTNTQLPAPKQGNQCVADHPNGYVVSPDGLLFNCWNEVHLPAQAASGRYDGIEDRINLQVMDENRVEWAEYDPFTHLPCETCSVAPLCMSGCPWESRKYDRTSTGYCTPLRFNLPDQLRLHHLQASVKQSLNESYLPEPEVDACATP